MDKAAIIPDRATVDKIILNMHSALQKHGVNPCHIALFGSFLHGTNHNESDLDIIIISELFEGRNHNERIKMTLNAELEVRKQYVVPMDILLKTPQEYLNPKMKFVESKIMV